MVPTNSPTPGPRSPAALANDAIRAYVAGRRSWSPAELRELDKLRAAWRQAIRDEVVTAA
ncbi:hypothetical protein [Streptomyces zagrosensis]|uniref:Uncharacterized protein n=1 Tax=Streptomyces zagrosensis TaxID=1042984 RepID=A0A7W9Q4W4_9ACTN|nr:hypothetical protein [Streptomyces zagrosensis]MBB5933656.1 hypothetical protein [Streptomyces zagrosensis]